MSLFRLEHWKPGPDLPSPIRFPCVLSIDQDRVFIFGEYWWSSVQLQAYILHQSNLSYTNVTSDIHSIRHPPIYGQYSCAYLKTNLLTVVTFENVTAVLNMKTLSWTTLPLPISNGIVLNSDVDFKHVFLIGSNKPHNSELYIVSTQ